MRFISQCRMRVSDFIPELPLYESNLKGNYAFIPENVYQIGNRANRKRIGELVDILALPGSRIDNVEALIELRSRSLAGESCIIMAEHYSNLDFPVLFRFIENHERLGTEIAESLLPIRGMKLSETLPIVAVFSRSYDTIVIYPSRTLDSITDPGELAEVRKRSVRINHAAMREMIVRKRRGRIIVVFPSGTRYRPWDPNTKKGVREIASYIRTFDNIVFVGINGNLLPVSKTGDMSQDEIRRDVIILTCSDIVNGRRYRAKMKALMPEKENLKSYLVNQVMMELEKIHSSVEPKRLKEKGLRIDRKPPESSILREG